MGEGDGGTAATASGATCQCHIACHVMAGFVALGVAVGVGALTTPTAAGCKGGEGG